MKKLLLTSSVTSLLAFSPVTMANSDMLGSKYQVYLKTEAGSSFLNTFKVPIHNEESKLKFNSSASVGAAVGCYFMDNVRFELGYNYYIPFTSKSIATQEVIDLGVGEDLYFNTNIYFKIKSQSLLPKIYLEFYKSPIGKVYIGTAIGSAKTRVKSTEFDISPQGGGYHLAKKTKTKNKVQLAYMLAIGTSYNVTDSLTTDIEYNWTCLGKVKIYNMKKASINMHNVKIGLRYKL